MWAGQRNVKRDARLSVGTGAAVCTVHLAVPAADEDQASAGAQSALTALLPSWKAAVPLPLPRSMQLRRAGGHLPHPRRAPPSCTQASVAEFRRETLAPDDQEEPGPPADTRPLSPAIAIVRLISGGALHGSVSGTHRQECLNPTGIRAYRPRSAPRRPTHTPTTSLLFAAFHRESRGRIDRTQEVGGSSPPSSIRSPW
jgi:hypothetical protein